MTDTASRPAIDAAAAHALGFDPDRLERVGRLIETYVDDGRFPCGVVQVSRRGEVAYRHAYGHRDVESAAPIAYDSVFRLYSMTKPITSIALMQLYEQGRCLLEDPVERYIESFADARVWTGGSQQAPQTRPVANPMTIHQVLTHTSGLTYGFFWQHPVDAMYRDRDLGNFSVPDYSLAEGMDRLAEVPLLFEPGTAWNYSMSTDVCGRLVEVISGQPLDVYLRDNIFDPLGMADTGFSVRADAVERLTSNYMNLGDGALSRIDSAATSSYLHPPPFLSGGGGLVGTLDDYQRFCDMLLDGGARDGVRIIGRKTLEFMASNHLPGGVTLNELGQSTFSETAMDGMGFGLGFSVLVDPAANTAVSSAGEFAWGGAASTAFWIDPAEELTVVYLTQFLPSNTYPIRRQLKAAVYQALV